MLDRWRAEHPTHDRRGPALAARPPHAPRDESSDYVLWYYTPMALPFTRQLTPQAVVYDCMDELSGFAGAPPELQDAGARAAGAAPTWSRRAGAACSRPSAAFTTTSTRFPAASTPAHFARARAGVGDDGREPPDQAAIPRPRIGFAGVIDERMDLALLAGVAEQRPDWQLVLLGPVAKIDPAALPRLPNMHYLGMKPYPELPDYMAGWDVGHAPLRAQRRHAIHQPDQDARVPGGGAAGGRHLDPRRGRALRDVAGWRESPTARLSSLPRSRRRWPKGAAPRLREVDELLGRGSWDADGGGDAPAHAARRGDAARRASEPCAAAASWPGRAAVTGPGAHRRPPPLRLPGGGRRVRRQRRGGAAGHLSGRARAAGRSPPPHRRQRLRSLRRLRDPGAPLRPAHLPHGVARRLRVPLPLHGVAQLPAPGDGGGRRAAGAHPHQPGHHQPADELALQQRASWTPTSSRWPSRSARSAPPRTPSSARWGASCTRSSFATTPASSGALDPSELDASVTSRIPVRTNRDDRYFTDAYQACRCTATRACSSACSTTATCTSCSTPTTARCRTSSRTTRWCTRGPSTSSSTTASACSPIVRWTSSSRR